MKIRPQIKEMPSVTIDTPLGRIPYFPFSFVNGFTSGFCQAHDVPLEVILPFFFTLPGFAALQGYIGTRKEGSLSAIINYTDINEPLPDTPHEQKEYYSLERKIKRAARTGSWHSGIAMVGAVVGYTYGKVME